MEGHTSLDSGWSAQPVGGATAPHAKPQVQAGTVEWDHKGRVVRSRFSNGQILQFRYDQQGCLYAFTYAGLAWSTASGARWTAVDEDNTYIIDGMIDVGIDGCLYVQKDGVRRSIKLNGIISDQLADGTVVESPRTESQLAPQDLLAVVKAKNHDTLNRLNPFRPTEESQAVSRAPAPSAKEMPSPPPGPAEPTRRSLAAGARIIRKEASSKATDFPAPQTDIVSWLKKTIATSKIAISEKLHGPDSLALAPQIDLLAAAAQADRRIDEARVLHERALEIRKKTLGPKHPDVGISMHGLATIYHDWGRFNEAEQYYLEGIKLLDNGFRKAVFLHSVGAVDADYLTSHLDRLVLSLHSLASMYHEYKRPQLCEQIYHAAAHICGKVGEPFRGQMAPKLESMLAMCAHLDMEKRPAEARLRISRWERRSQI
jgi:YD repeat-containing protein